MTAQQNFSNYREKLAACTPPVVPYLGASPYLYFFFLLLLGLSSTPPPNRCLFEGYDLYL